MPSLPKCPYCGKLGVVVINGDVLDMEAESGGPMHGTSTNPCTPERTFSEGNSSRGIFQQMSTWRTV